MSGTIGYHKSFETKITRTAHKVVVAEGTDLNHVFPYLNRVPLNAKLVQCYEEHQDNSSKDPGDPGINQMVMIFEVKQEECCEPR